MKKGIHPKGRYKMKVLVYDIKWETDGYKVKLPKNVIIDMDTEGLDEEDVIEEINDFLSDEYGWLVTDYNYRCSIA